PYIENYTSGGVSFNLTAEQSADTMKADDLLYAVATELSNARTDINFTHLMTKLNVEVTSLGSEVEDGDEINKVEISDLAKAATFYPENGTLTADNELTGSTVAYNNGTTYEALVFPTACSSVAVKVTMNSGKVFTTTVDLAGINNELAGGYQYNISLQVGQDVVTIGGITAEPWVPSAGGVLETE
ncbi:MAG: fimbrillin family protein, partial [Bacteroidales bacterium]|nr:fimbrillin family protein [Bacteroidales bacterium]